ncbi:secreted protein [Penicillium alfredii]|uniref:Secreted protein n=1 Tax=Penicillium alfredii TaxID=1506179 RepID=A0A9W9ELI1_9EURO|nr:uncharacterized protein NUU61_008657 [Penicillium alfredii]KAJ5084078.1 secreted protein [Penicillium alfredii]
MSANQLKLVLLGTLALFSSPIAAYPAPETAPAPALPGVPSASTAQNELAQLILAPQGPQEGYSRAKFPHWITQRGICDTREVALKRDGTNVAQSPSCAPISGSWYSPYDGRTWDRASDIDIDYVVPLSNAWKSGASEWTTDRRRAFANDVTHPQLLAVTDFVNQVKGDKGPEDW